MTYLSTIFYIPICKFCSQLMKHGYSPPIAGDTIKYKVWLPKVYNSLEKYLSIFINSYGALGCNLMLARADFHNGDTRSLKKNPRKIPAKNLSFRGKCNYENPSKKSLSYKIVNET